jgi:multicomponent Na+:H+ antiporter subunit G
MIQDMVVTILLILGTLLMLLASIGIVRMPDVFLRMSASTKAATLGVILIMLATVIHFNDLAVTARAVGVVVFIILTGPVSAHMIARAAYITGAKVWSGTRLDELQGRYNPETHVLSSQPAEPIDPN